MKIEKTGLNDCYLIKPKVFSDARGFFFESYQKERYSNGLGILYEFVQDNISKSDRGVLRGLHFQINKPQGKLVSVIQGSVYDIAVDLRPESSTYGKWIGEVLSGNNKNQLLIPPGFAHGFITLENDTVFSYKCTDYYDSNDEGGIIWNDPTLNINWGTNEPIVSEKDNTLPYFKEIF
ncbi:dTDP-4-dehydrorhamnose 3,5-epimerase [Photobacterium kagoshimensis]|uniref:dTDP-4-dehydrorhamnose 3,5-epimerase n=1 Tax=Photobacterium kagoshimensis TaxID=2910242 RepID=UPI003D10D806